MRCAKQVTIYAVAMTLLCTSWVQASTWTEYVIRHGAGDTPPVIQSNNDYVAGATEFIIALGSQKAALGSNDANGATLGSLYLQITRHDDSTRFNAGSGPAVAPYLNIWITDGLGNYAVVANEPSNPSFAAFRTDLGSGSFSYAFSIEDIAGEVAQVYETPNGGFNSTNTWVHNLLGLNQVLTFGDIASLIVDAPDASYITDAGNAVGGGAPRELGTNSAYGVNWVFGDTLANYVSGAEGYVVSNAHVAVVPLPAAVWAGFVMLGGMGGVRAWKRRRAAA